jgi:hypothetical protein
MDLNCLSFFHHNFGQEFVAIVELFANCLAFDFVANFILAECGTLFISSVAIHLMNMRSNVYCLI